MTTTMLSTAIVVSGPMFSDAERVAVGGYLAGYSGLTREAYALDLRQFSAWCEEHRVHLFEARHADIECFGRDLEERGRARATATLRDRRFLPLRSRGGASRSLGSSSCPPAAPRLRVSRHRPRSQRTRRSTCDRRDRASRRACPHLVLGLARQRGRRAGAPRHDPLVRVRDPGTYLPSAAWRRGWRASWDDSASSSTSRLSSPPKGSTKPAIAVRRRS